MPGQLKAFLRKLFGSDFFAHTLLSQGRRLLTPASLGLWDQIHQGKAQHSAGLVVPPQGPPQWGAARRRLKEELQVVRQEMLYRGLLPPPVMEVVRDGLVWCPHCREPGPPPPGAVVCDRCGIRNCARCRNFLGQCRSAGRPAHAGGHAA